MKRRGLGGLEEEDVGWPASKNDKGIGNSERVDCSLRCTCREHRRANFHRVPLLHALALGVLFVDHLPPRCAPTVAFRQQTKSRCAAAAHVFTPRHNPAAAAGRLELYNAI